MFCKKCGQEIADDAVVCVRCGCAVKDLPAEEEKSQGNGMAIAGFVCSFFVPLLGWIFGGIGLARANKRKGKGKGLSIAALAIASAMFVLGLAVNL